MEKNRTRAERRKQENTTSALPIVHAHQKKERKTKVTSNGIIRKKATRTEKINT